MVRRGSAVRVRQRASHKPLHRIANASTSLFQAKNEGYIEDVLTAPLRAWHLVAAYMAGAVVRALAAAFVIASPLRRLRAGSSTRLSPCSRSC